MYDLSRRMLFRGVYLMRERLWYKTPPSMRQIPQSWSPFDFLLLMLQANFRIVLLFILAALAAAVPVPANQGMCSTMTI